MIDSKIVNQNFWLLDVAKKIRICSEARNADKQVTADFFLILYVSSDAMTRKSKLLTDFRTWYWRICSWSLLLKLNVWLQRRHVVDLFVDSDLCKTSDVFSISHTKLIALTERWEFLTNFRSSWLRICSYNFLLKLKFCLQSLQITRTHVTSWFDALFIDFDVFLNVEIERFKYIDETDWLIVFSTSACFWDFCSINSICFWVSCSINSICFWTSCSRWCAWRVSCCSILWRSASWHEEDLR